MAKPRVFISSTFYDLRQIREDLDRFILDMGYEPVRHETGAIPYSKTEKLETAAYRELQLCDMIVCVIGGRFGTASIDREGYSITQAELKTALEQGVQVFIFIEKGVHSEYRTYLRNKGKADITWSFADDSRVYSFIEEIHALPINNAIHGFETGLDIITFLRQQWAGLFKQFLQDKKREPQLTVLDELRSTAATLRELVSFLTDERKNKDEAIKNILLVNHPIFRRLATLTATGYRLFFATHTEMATWLTARGWTRLAPTSWDEGSVEEWLNSAGKKYMAFTASIFDEAGKLKIFSESEWRDEWITVSDVPPDADTDSPPSPPPPPLRRLPAIRAK